MIKQNENYNLATTVKYTSFLRNSLPSNRKKLCFLRTFYLLLVLRERDATQTYSSCNDIDKNHDSASVCKMTCSSKKAGLTSASDWNGQVVSKTGSSLGNGVATQILVYTSHLITGHLIRDLQIPTAVLGSVDSYRFY